MGKIKPNKRFGALRPNPTDSLEFALKFDEECTDSETAPAVITNIIEQLNDPTKEEKIQGCQHMAKIISRPNAMECLLKKDVVKITAPLFLDSCSEVQRGALGAMRNLSVFGEEKVCDLMIKNDVLTSLFVVIRKYSETYGSGHEGIKLDVAAAILLEAVELLSNLCESINKALQMFNKEGIISHLLPLLNTEVCGYRLATSVAHCLHVVSESNANVSKVCKEPAFFSQLMNVVTSSPTTIDAILYRTHVIRILLNLSEADLSQYYDRFIQVAGEVLDMDCLPLIKLAIEGKGDSGAMEDVDVDFSQEDFDKLIAAQRVSLEMLANLCCLDDEWEEMEGDATEELSDGDEVVDCSGEGMLSEEVTGELLCLPSEIHSALVTHNLLAKIMKKAHPLDPSQTSSLEPLHYRSAILQRLEDLQSRALLCFSNMIGALCDSDETQSSLTTSIWTELYSLAKSYEGKSEDFLWALTSAMRSTLQKMSEADKDQVKSVSQEDLEFLLKMGTDSENRETQINVIRMLSTIGCVLAVQQDQHHIVKTIGEILIQVCSSNQDVVVVSEALDSVFDVFKEDDTDPVAKQIGLVRHLKSIKPNFKAKFSSERKSLGEHYGIVMMAWSNLTAFLKYKIARSL